MEKEQKKQPPRTKKIKEVKEEIKEVKEEIKKEEPKKEEIIIEKKEEKKEEPKVIVEKESNTGFLLVLTALVLVLAALCFYGFYYVYNNMGSDKRKAADLKYTETVEPNKNPTDGVFITDVSGVVENVMPSIVSITSKTIIKSGNYGPYYRGTTVQTGAGSGIIISQSDSEILILTNNHVVEGAKELSVQFINGMSYDATIKGTSEVRDVAVIAVKKKDVDTETLEKIKIATLGDSSKLKVGEGVIAIGNALGYGQSVTTGVVSALNRQVTVDKVSNKMIQLDAAINGGNSGGALLNSRGEVVGINSIKYSTSVLSSSASIEGMGFAIPISDVKDLIEELMNGNNDDSTENIDKERGYIGITGYMVTDDMSEKYGMPKGVYIQEISKGSKVISEGVIVGNIITKINGKEVTEFNTITEALSDKKPGDTVKLTIKYGTNEGYQEKEVTVELSSYEDVQ